MQSKLPAPSPSSRDHGPGAGAVLRRQAGHRSSIVSGLRPHRRPSPTRPGSSTLIASALPRRHADAAGGIAVTSPSGCSRTERRSSSTLVALAHPHPPLPDPRRPGRRRRALRLPRRSASRTPTSRGYLVHSLIGCRRRTRRRRACSASMMGCPGRVMRAGQRAAFVEDLDRHRPAAPDLDGELAQAGLRAALSVPVRRGARHAWARSSSPADLKPLAYGPDDVQIAGAHRGRDSLGARDARAPTRPWPTSAARWPCGARQHRRMP